MVETKAVSRTVTVLTGSIPEQEAVPSSEVRSLKESSGNNYMTKKNFEITVSLSVDTNNHIDPINIESDLQSCVDSALQNAFVIDSMEVLVSEVTDLVNPSTSEEKD